MARLTQDDKETVGFYNGVFNSFQVASLLLGNLIIGLLFQFTQDANGNVPYDITVDTLWILFALGLAAAVIMLFLRSVVLLPSRVDSNILRPTPKSSSVATLTVKSRVMAVI